MNRVVNIDKLKPVLAEHRENVKNLRDHATTPEGRMVHIGELRELNNTESLLREFMEVIDGEPEPFYKFVQVPRDHEELAAILFAKWELPANLSDYQYQSYCDQLAHRFPAKRDHILFIYHLFRSQDLIDAVLLFARENRVEKKQISSGGSVSELLQSQIEIPEKAPKSNEPNGLSTFLCPHCQKPFKYQKALNNHVNKFHPLEKRKDMKVENESAGSTCPFCGKGFKYPRSLQKHKESCKLRKRGEEDGNAFGKGLS